MPTVAAAPLTDFTRALFVAIGVPSDEAAIVARSLVGANLRGHDSHGVLRALQYVESIEAGRIKPGAELTAIHETPAVLAADAGWGLGQVQAFKLLDRLWPKVQALGLAAGTLRCCGHVGRLGEYAEAAAERQLALFATVNNHGGARRVAPPGGIEGRLSTNPICLGAPTDEGPLILDMGTSVAAEGKVRVRFQKGESVPEGWLLDAHGEPTTDPGVLYREPRGSILPLGGAQAYKGFGLSLLLDALAGGLSGGPCSRGDVPMPAVGNTVLFVLFDPAQFGGLEHFRGEAAGLAGFVRSCPRTGGVDEIVLPGDLELRALRQRERAGIPISDGTWVLLAALAQRLGVPTPPA